MIEFVAFMANMYSYRKIDENLERPKQRSKGKKWVDAESLTFDDYNTCLFESNTMYRKEIFFKNKKHALYMVIKHEIALNRNDYKRLVKADGIIALASGYLA